MRSHVATFKVSCQLLCELLHLPSDTEIIACWGTDDYSYPRGPANVCFKVSHPDLKVVEKGENIPEISPTFKKQEPVIFVGWGQA